MFLRIFPRWTFGTFSCGYFWVMRRCVSVQTERGNSRGGATKKRAISRTSLTINIHFSSHNMKYFPK